MCTIFDFSTYLLFSCHDSTTAPRLAIQFILAFDSCTLLVLLNYCTIFLWFCTPAREASLGATLPDGKAMKALLAYLVE